ncbi:MAG: hypothetical protein ABSE73_05305 [Planctomycetota bacterium]
MSGLSLRYLVRMLALALVLAVGCFCYATSTSVRSRGLASGSDSPAAGRLLGSSPLRYTNPVYQQFPYPQPTTYDLGDAAFGSTIVRYITVTGGVRPYNFVAVDLSSPNLGFNSSLTLHPSGYLIGSITNSTPPPLNFQVAVSDSRGQEPNNLTDVFRLNLVALPAGAFQFAVDRLNNGVVGKSHAAKLETLNGNGVQFSTLPGTLALNGVITGTTGQLETFGLTLAADGTIYGRPLVDGKVSVTARAKDQHNNIARDRTGQISDQVVTFNVETNQTASTDYTTLKCHIQADIGQFSKDSISFSGVINLSGTQWLTLVGTPFELHVGRAKFSGFLNYHGIVVNAHGGPAVYADGSALHATVNPHTGIVQGTVKRASLYHNGWTDLASVQDRSTARAGIMLNCAHFILGSDMLDFATRRTGNKIALDYKLGSIGQPLGGAFQVVSVLGVNRKTVAGLDGVAWTAKFIIIPRFGVDPNAGLDDLSVFRVRIGTNFDQSIAGHYFTSTRSGDTQLMKNNYLGEYVSKATFSPTKFTGTIQTQSLSTYTTGLPQATAQANSNFTLALDVQRGGTSTNFYGEVGRAILAHPRKKYWGDQK